MLRIYAVCAALLCIAGAAHGRVIAMTYGMDVVAPGKKPSARLDSPAIRGRVILLPWSQVPMALGLLQEGKGAEDMWTEAQVIAQALASADEQCRDNVPDTMMIVYLRREPVDVVVSEFEYSDDDPTVSKVSELSEARKNELTEMAGRFAALRVIVDRVGGFVPFHRECRGIVDGQLDARGYLDRPPHDTTGSWGLVVSEGPPWTAEYWVDSHGTTMWVRYSPLYGTMCCVFYATFQTGEIGIGVLKLMDCWDSAGPVPVEALSRPIDLLRPVTSRPSVDTIPVTNGQPDSHSLATVAIGGAVVLGAVGAAVVWLLRRRRPS